MNSDKKETQIMRTAEQENKETLTADILPRTLQETFLSNELIWRNYNQHTVGCDGTCIWPSTSIILLYRRFRLL
jgi:hypothetical protein